MEDLDFRLRLLEERYGKVRERLILINQNMIDEFKLFTTSVETLSEEIKLLRQEMEEIKSITQSLLRASKQFADKKDVKVLEKYISVWNPMNFATQKDLERAMSKKGGQ